MSGGIADPPAESAVRYALPDEDDLDQAQVELIQRILQGPRAGQRGTVPLSDADGRLTGVFSLMPISPVVGDRVQALGAALRFDSALSPISRELAILAVAVSRESDFEWFAHHQAALAVGVTPSQLVSLRAGQLPDGLPHETEAVLRLLAELLRAGGVSDHGYAAACRDLGVERMADVVWLCGYYSMLAAALATFRPPLPEGAQGVLRESAATETLDQSLP